MSSEIEKLNFKYESLDKKVDKILLYLYNDKDTNNKGIIQQVKDLRDDVDNIKGREKMRAFKVGLFSGICGTIGGIILKFIF